MGLHSALDLLLVGAFERIRNRRIHHHVSKTVWGTCLWFLSNHPTGKSRNLKVDKGCEGTESEIAFPIANSQRPWRIGCIPNREISSSSPTNMQVF